ncbi:MAG: hypothetical protein AB7O04_03600 [Hyphomonadaceae bacterium]
MTATLDTSAMPTRAPRAALPELALDAAIFAAAFGVCAALASSGGLWAILAALLSAAFAARRGKTQTPLARRTLSGAFIGLWIGMILAGFFHAGLVNSLGALR